MGVESTRPSYTRLVEMLKSVPNTRASRSWLDRVLGINNLKGMLGIKHQVCMLKFNIPPAPEHAGTITSVMSSENSSVCASIINKCFGHQTP